MMMPLVKKRDLVGLVILAAVFVAIGLLRLPLQAVLLVAIPLSIAITFCHAAAGEGMNSDANPIWTLVWTFGLMSLFAVGGANSAIPEMHRVAVDVQHWMTDKQFADVFAISQIVAGAERADRDPDRLFRRRRCRRAGRDAGDVRTDRDPCLLCEPSFAALEPFALARDHSGGAGSTFDRADGRQWPDFGADLGPDLGRGPDYGGRSGLRLCHAAQSFLDVAGWRHLWVLLALSEENR